MTTNYNREKIERCKKVILDHLPTVSQDTIIITNLEYLISVRKKVEEALDTLIEISEWTFFTRMHPENAVERATAIDDHEVVMLAMMEILEEIDERYDWKKVNFFTFHLRAKLVAATCDEKFGRKY